MRAIVIEGTQGLDSLHVREINDPPAPVADQLLVRVRAAGVNRADLLQARGLYPAPPGAPADIPGLEFAGEIEQRGPASLGPLQVGDRVFGITGGGAMAERLLIHERLAVPIPANLDWPQAGAIPEAFLTAHDALTARAQIHPGERVLIHAAAGGVGLAATQLAHAMGCLVIGTSRSPQKRERMLNYGVDFAVDTTYSDWPEAILAATDGQGVNVIIDHLGGPFWDGNLACLARLGRIVIVGLLAGAKAHVDLRVLMDKRATIVGTVLRARPIEEKIAATQAFQSTVLPWLSRGLVRPVVDSTFPLDQARDAFSRMDSNQSFGKIVLLC